MKIGVIGTRLMGRALGLRWARERHTVLFGSRGRDKAEAAAASTPHAAYAGDCDAAAAFGDVVLYTVRSVFPSSLLRDPQAPSGKILIDCNNSDIPALNNAVDPCPAEHRGCCNASPGRTAGLIER